MRGDSLDLSSRKNILDVGTQRLKCCHTGGSIAFDNKGNLYLSTGDNSNPFASGYAPLDERPDRMPWDAQKSSGNTNDLRGKIIRIHPEPDGSYTIPAGNLFPPGTPKTRPEIYTMPTYIQRSRLTMTQPGTGKYEQLLQRCRDVEPIPTAVAWPCEETALAGALDAASKGLIVPILTGPAKTIREIAKAAGLDLGKTEIVEASDSRDAAAKAVALVREGRAELVMKGSLHSDEILGAVIAKETGLRSGRRLSHAYVMDVPTYHKPLLITDAAINIAPTLEEKVDIVQNAIDLALAFGVKRPKVAILAAVETVSSKMPATLDAAALCKMADRGQITGGLLDGPLAFDNAINLDAAKTKRIESEVAGDPDILLAPDLESGNIMAKMLTFLANAEASGLVLGAKVPVILTSRSDSLRARIASTAVAVLAADARRKKGPDARTRSH